MKKQVLLLAAIICTMQLWAQNYVPVDDGSAIKFTIKNFGINVNGNFKNLKGKIVFNPANPATASVTATVDATTVNTGTDSRDNHLRKEEYFDVKKYPVITIVSTKITSSGTTGSFLMEAKVTIKDVTKTISFPFTAVPKGDDYILAGEFKLNRRDFGVGGSSMVMSDNLTVSLSVLAKKAN